MSSTLRQDPVCSCPITDYRGLRLEQTSYGCIFQKKNERRRY